MRRAAPAPLAIGLDVGGTKIAGAVVTPGGEIVAETRVRTPNVDKGEAVIQALLDVVEELRRRHPTVEAIGVGAAGLVEWPEGHIRWAPNNSYADVPLRRLVQDATGLPTEADNDANMAAYAEWRFGAAAGAGDMVMITVGTGIGGALIQDGKVVHGRSGLAGEVGHIAVAPGGPRCSCGNIGCLEAMVSGTALRRLGRAAAEKDEQGRLATLAGAPDSATGEMVSRAAAEGDPVARSLLVEIGSWLGVGIATLVTILDLDAVVIGGGLIHAGDLLLDPARASFERHVFARKHRTLPAIVPAALGPRAGAVGAAALAFESRRVR